jgi:imidazolonepropionase-like amidohydrolase
LAVSGQIGAAGLYTVPGLIDCHVHVIACTAEEHALTMEAPSYVTAHAAVELQAMLHRGFTTVRDMAGADYGLARAVAESVLPGPRLFTGGKAAPRTSTARRTRTPPPPGCSVARAFSAPSRRRRTATSSSRGTIPSTTSPLWPSRPRRSHTSSRPV